MLGIGNPRKLVYFALCQQPEPMPVLRMCIRSLNRFPTCRLRWVGLLLAAVWGLPGWAQPFHPWLQHYTPQDYGQHEQNFCAVQDRRGVMYFANNNGVLEYDGAQWKILIGTKRARTLALNRQGQLCVGTYGDFGYVAEVDPEKAEYGFHSLRDSLPQAERSIGRVLNILQAPQRGMYFLSERQLIHWREPELQNWPAPNPDLGLVGGCMQSTTLWVADETGNLYTHSPNGWQLRVSGKALKQGQVVSMISMSDGARLRVFTEQQGVFDVLCEGDSDCRVAQVRLPDLTAHPELRIFHASRLREGRWAVATRHNGVRVLDSAGVLLTTLNQTHGLGSDETRYTCPDRDGNLWICTDNGIGYAALGEPVWYAHRAQGLEGSFRGLYRNDETLYVLTSLGVYRSTGNRFEPLPGVTGECRAMIEAGGRQLLALNQGLFERRGQRLIQLNPFQARVFCASKKFPGRIWVGGEDGLAFVDLKPGGPQFQIFRDGNKLNARIETLHETNSGNLWVGAPGLGRLYHLEWQAGDTARVRTYVQGWNQDLKVPLTRHLGVVEFQDRIYTHNGLYLFRLDTQTDRFVVDTTLGRPFGGSYDLGRLKVSADGQFLWLITHELTGAKSTLLWRYPAPAGKGDTSRVLFPVVTLPQINLYALETGSEGQVWFSSVNRVMEYVPARSGQQPEQLPPILLRKVVAGEKSDIHTFLFVGAGPGNATDPAQPDMSVLDYQQNALRFEFTLPVYSTRERIEYEYLLEGYDDTWYPVSEGQGVSFTNLLEGSYTFRVRARDLQGRLSPEAAYAFRILPPWYRSWWAYLLWGLVFLGMVYGIVQWRLQTLREKNRQLEEIVSQRTKEIRVLHDIGREITASLDFQIIFRRLYHYVNELMPAEGFGIFLYREAEKKIDISYYIENGVQAENISLDINDKNWLAVWCIENRKPIRISNIEQEYMHYVQSLRTFYADLPKSVIYLPLLYKDQLRGVITVQSFIENAYTEKHLDLLESLAAYALIAIENAQIYSTLEDQHQELEAANDQIQKQFTKLTEAYQTIQQQQGELVKSEKMAILSQLAPIIQHEMNTPLGVIQSVTQQLNEHLPELFRTIPEMVAGFSDEEYHFFWDTLGQTVANYRERPLKLSTREQRRLSRDIEEQLDEHEVPDAEDLAEDLIKLQLMDHLDVLVPRLKTLPEAHRILKQVFEVARIFRQVMSAQQSVRKAQEKLEAFREYVDTREEMYFRLRENIELVTTFFEYHLIQVCRPEIDLDVMPEIKGNPGDLLQVWTNLIMNAVDALRSPKIQNDPDQQAEQYFLRVTSMVDRQAGQIRIQFTDNGPGIPPEIQSRVFEPRFTTREQHNGMGLAVAQEIIEAHGGHISVRSRPEPYTTFTVTLPLPETR